MELSENAKKIITDRYLILEKGETSWKDLATRVGTVISNGDGYAERFADIINRCAFIPGGRILRNAGRERGSLFNCYHLPIGDSIDEIGECAANALKLWSDGGGVGINFSQLRPVGTAIQGLGGRSSGLVSFMRAIDGLAACIESGGSRRAASLGSCDISHPEIRQFIDAKLVDGTISYFNISVNITKSFLEHVMAQEQWPLTFRGKVFDTVDAVELWHKMLTNMISVAEPGLLIWDNLIKNNSYYFNPVRGCNPSLRAGTRILTSDGIKKIEDLENKNFKIQNINSELSSANCFLSGINKQLYKINFQGGHEYFATKEHKWPITIFDSWNYDSSMFNKKQTSDLKPGDCVPIPNFKERLPFGNIGSYEEGFVIGWNIGDGWISLTDNRVLFGFIVSKEDSEYGIHVLIETYLKKLGWTGAFHDKKGNKETTITNKNVEMYFKRFGVVHKTKGIPTSIWSSASEEFRKGFIDALFSADGHIDIGSKRICLVSAHKQLITDISDLLGFYGINTSIKHSTVSAAQFPNNKQYNKTYERYELAISRLSSIYFFNKLFKLTNIRKQKSIESLVKNITCLQPSRILKVVSVEQTDIFENVWDISVQDTYNCFELSQVVTGNCGEAALGAFDVCDLGSIVLPKFVDGGGRTKWSELEEVVKLAVRFLDNVIEVNKYRLPANQRMAQNGRRIGIGVMGLAEYLFQKELRYGSSGALSAVEDLLKFIRDTAYLTSAHIATERGAFPAYEKVQYHKASFIRALPPSIRRVINDNGVRNVTCLALAPTGTISLIPEVTGGIEPLFSKAYRRNDRVGSRVYVHPIARSLIERGVATPDWFVDTRDLSPVDHLEMQRMCQKYVDGAVSKTINVPSSFTVDDLSSVLFEYLFDIKGVTVYRDGSRKGQILNHITMEEASRSLKKSSDVPSEESVACATGACEL